MKIKGKLLAGGLMTAIACGIAGSITSTFAWYQYSNSHTTSMHGISVGASQNLQLKLDGVTGADWVNGNLVWDDTGSGASVVKGISSAFTTDQKDVAGNVKLSPVSNGANDGNSLLNDDWYGNPDGSQSTLPIVTSGFMQFSFHARIAETVDGTNWTYPAGTLYVTDIAGVSDKLPHAIRMHVQMGDTDTASDTCFVVNPVERTSDDVLLSATLSQSRQYDWENTTTSTSIAYRLPTNANADSNSVPETVEGERVLAGHLISLADSAIVATHDAQNDNALTGGKSHAIPSNNGAGLKITVTVWIEGFEQAADAANTSSQSQWWDVATTVEDAIRAGFELTAVKD